MINVKIVGMNVGIDEIYYKSLFKIEVNKVSTKL